MSDYSDIQQELDDFKNAVYGEEVRDSMVSAIKKIHDIAERAAGAPDASTATAGQAPVADGAGGWAWGDVEAGDSVPTEVRQALFTLLNNAVYRNTDLQDEKAIIQSWASEVTSISVSPTTLSLSGSTPSTITAVTSPAGGAVTWSSSNTSVATVSGGVVTGVSNGTCTITASCGSKSATCAVTVSGFATLTGISAVYTQSGTVYDTDTLDSLKSDLVVTASYDDSTTQTVTGYTLSGTLTEGTSTITVTFGGCTDTFDVTVTADTLTLIASWDFTDSLVDSVGSVTAVTTGTQGSTGLVFGEANKYLELPSVYARGRTYEIDVLSIAKAYPGNNARLFAVDGDANTGSGGACYIISGNKQGGDLFYIGGWESSNIIVPVADDANGSFYNGRTVGFYVDDAGYCSVYVDGVYIGKSSSVIAASFNGKNVYIGGSSADSMYNATFTGYRIYEGFKYRG